MRASVQRRVTVGVAAALAAGLVASGYILNKFRGYEDNASRIMMGEQRSVLIGHLLEARVKGAVELAETSVSSEQADQAFKEHLASIADEIKSLKINDEVPRILNELTASRAESLGDLFVLYRNIKSHTFNLYRLAWANKWMSVAKSLGILINDLDNLSYHSADKVLGGVGVKIAQLTAITTNSNISQESKLMFFGQLGILKTSAERYDEALQRASTTRTLRVERLKQLAGILKKFSDMQGKGVLQFGHEARAEVFRAVIAFLFFVLFAMFWYWIVAKRFGVHIERVAGHVSRQIAGWITTGGNVAAQEFKFPERPDTEFVEMYQVIDQTMRKLNSLRKEDVLVKRLLNVPLILINRSKQAIFWNSALSILGKVRALEEMGPVAYGNLVSFTSAQNKVVDPIEKAFAETKEIAQLALLKTGDDRVAVQVVCTPVLGPDHQAEYVMVHVRDLREENRRHEAELDRQLVTVRAAVEQIWAGGIPDEPPVGVRKPLLDAMRMLQDFALGLQEQAKLMSGQVGTMRERMAREAGLKKTVHGRTGQLRDEVAGLNKQLGELRHCADGLTQRLTQVEARNKSLKDDYSEVRARGVELMTDLEKIQRHLLGCTKLLEQAEEISARTRSNERMVHSILEKSSLLNANNSILGAKRELTPTDVMTITENITQLMGQFERSSRFIEQAVKEVETGLQELSAGVRDNLDSCIRLTEEDKAIMSAVRRSEKIMETATDETHGFMRELAAMRSASGRLGLQIQGIENKVHRLVQIGNASIELQRQLEVGFEGMFALVSSETDAPEAPQAPESELA